MISVRARAALKQFEGYRATAYQDVAGVWTIGWGHTPAIPGQTITEREAEDLLENDIWVAEAAVQRLVKVPLSPGQLDALVSFVFNLGAGRLQSSTLLAKLNDGDIPGAAAEFARWVHAGGRVLPGLEKRREIEAGWFREGVATAAAEPATQPPAPVEDRITAPSKEPAMAIPALVPIALQAISAVVPAVAGLLNDKTKSVPERNITAAARIVDAAKEAVGAINEQDMIEKIQADPAAAAQAKQAVQGIWFEIVEGGGGGIAGAREADRAFIASGAKPWQSPAFVITILLLLMPFGLLVDVFYVHPGAYDGTLRVQVVTAVLAIIMIVSGYWIGTSASSARKTELLGGDK